MNFLEKVEEKVPDVTIRNLVIHKKLVSRLAILGIVATFLLVTIVYDALQYGFIAFSTLPAFGIGLVLGAALFSRISDVVWDEEREAVSIGKMDLIGFGVLVLYYALDIGLRSIVLNLHQGSDFSFVRSLVVAGVLGAAIGRLAWFTVEIHKMRKRLS